MTSIKIAVLELDRKRSTAICRALVSYGHVCESFISSGKLQERLHAEHFDLLVLGKGRGGADAVEIVRYARSGMQPELPILLVAANGDTDAVARALAAGANDYLCLPVRAAELKARVSVLLARAYPEKMALERAQYGPFLFDAYAHRLTLAGKAVKLTPREFDLALLLFRHLGQPLSRATIGEAVWGKADDISSRTVDTHVSRVRSKLQLRPECGYRLAQVYGYGYRLERTDAPGT